MRKYFPELYKPFGGDTNVTVDLSNYATKVDIKNISRVDTSSFPLETNLPNLKTDVDELDIDKLVSVPVDLSKLLDVVKNDVTIGNNIDTSGFVLRTKHDTDKSKLEFLM